MVKDQNVEKQNGKVKLFELVLVTLLTVVLRYDLDVPLTSMHSTRLRPEHDKRRRDMSSAFSDRSLRSYEQRTRPYVEQLYHSIEKSKGKPINVAQLVSSAR